MRILQFKVTGQNLSKDGDFSGIVAGTKGYLYTEYNFDSEWDGCKKAAVFLRCDKEYPVPIMDTCGRPSLSHARANARRKNKQPRNNNRRTKVHIRRYYTDDGRYYWRLRTMKTLNNLKMKIMVRAFRIRIKNGEAFEDIAADYPALTVDDLETIKAALEK